MNHKNIPPPPAKPKPMEIKVTKEGITSGSWWETLVLCILGGFFLYKPVLAIVEHFTN